MIVQEKFFEAFKDLDRDGNGLISAAELRQGMQILVLGKLLGKLSHRDVDDIIREADVDGDEQINYKEVYNLMIAKFGDIPTDEGSTDEAGLLNGEMPDFLFDFIAEHLRICDDMDDRRDSKKLIPKSLKKKMRKDSRDLNRLHNTLPKVLQATSLSSTS